MTEDKKAPETPAQATVAIVSDDRTLYIEPGIGVVAGTVVEFPAGEELDGLLARGLVRLADGKAAETAQGVAITSDSTTTITQV